MIRSVVCAAAIIVATTSSVDAYTVVGEGNLSCGIWLQAKREADPEDRQHVSAWVLGYISAMNEQGLGQGDLTRGTDVAGLEAWIDNYCSANPLDQLYMATNSLIAELLRRHPQ